MNPGMRMIMLTVALAAATGCAQRDRQDSLRERIAGAVDEIRLVDTHEHLSPEKQRVERESSLFTTLHYAISDMWADGLDRRLADSVFNDPGIPPERKWELMAPRWENTRHTAYSRALELAFRDLYGIERVDETTYAELSSRISEANRPGQYREVLGRRAGIDMAVCDVGWRGAQMDPELFRAVIRFDEFLLPWDAFGAVEERVGFGVNDLAGWERALEESFRLAKEQGFVGIKSGMAYNRTLDYEDVPRERAQELFRRLRDNPELIGSLPFEQRKPLQDYMMGCIADLCAEHDLPFQIHTGLFYDTWRDVSQANPTNMTPFIMRHRDTRFVLMHCGYPYGRELLAMAKNLPNVVLDMCWIYVISPQYASDFLYEAIETVPMDKVLGFGGDYVVPEGTYGHAVLCRRVVTDVLTRRVREGYFTEQEALAYARAILRGNPARVFGLEL